ncbi:MAG: CoA pyrophosphatase [Flavobacterium sp.]|jgi:8-oxo-dGTP pyrophosphatase MutT (NUDIX family)|nr:CoA pyrophosphatase [Flavobacterium sp.]
MDFQVFLTSILKIEREPLLADLAHQIMVPPERIELLKKVNIQENNPKKAAVLILLYPKNNRTHLVLIERNSYLGVHSSQIAFPGGKVEVNDPSVAFTALRETQEEIGVEMNKVSIIKAFTEVYIPPSNFMVFPFLGYVNEELQFNPEPREVASVIELSIENFLDERLVVTKEMNTSYSNSIRVPAFKIKEYYVWGATAMILSEVKEVLKKII